MKFLVIFLLLFTFSSAHTIEISSSNASSDYEKLTYKIVEDKAKELSRFLELSDLTLKVSLFDDPDKFYQLTGLPEHIPGALLSTQNIIYLKTPDVTMMDRMQFQNLIVHEMLHAIQNQIISLVLFPDWFNEGFAEFFSGSFGVNSKIRLSKLLLTKYQPDLSQLTHIDHCFSQPASDKYILSASAIEFLQINFGESIFNTLFQDMHQTKNFQKSLENVTHLTFDQFNFYWQQYLNKRYDKLFLMDLNYIIWLFLPFLFIFSFIVKQILNQSILNKWKYERIEEEINQIFTNFSVDDPRSEGTGSVPRS
ncbi:MAG: hypothetical protein JXQ65_12545 [Candidatus Marinimicrobia bacterium]|nr:hypothetical protein [Candidatus Neomarinimicrobiota bacterium]